VGVGGNHTIVAVLVDVTEGTNDGVSKMGAGVGAFVHAYSSKQMTETRNGGFIQIKTFITFPIIKLDHQ
jgi:hypothetical protein